MKWYPLNIHVTLAYDLPVPLARVLQREHRSIEQYVEVLRLHVRVCGLQQATSVIQETYKKKKHWTDKAK